MSAETPTWIIAACAVIWTVRMILIAILNEMDRRWPYGGAPKPIRAYAVIVSALR